MALSAEKLKQRIEGIHRMGRSRFIFLVVVLGWGLSTALVFTLIRYFLAPPFQVRAGAFAVLTFSLAGIRFGWLIWQANERRYQTNQQGPRS